MTTQSAVEEAARLHAELLESEAQTDRLRAQRDDSIRAAIRDGETMYAIGKRLEISQQAVSRIRDRG